MQVWNVLHAARCKYRTQKWCKKSPSGHHRTTLSGYIFATKAHIDNRKKTAAISPPTYPYNMVNFGPLAAEILSLVWDTPANFNGFRVLAALLHSKTAALNRGRHLYSAGRPSRWALAHISSCDFFPVVSCPFFSFQRPARTARTMIDIFWGKCAPKPPSQKRGVNRRFQTKVTKY